MVRFPRFFEKKRGNRRTGSHVWGSLGEGLFFAALFTAGIVFAVMLVGDIAWQGEGEETPGIWALLLSLVLPGALLSIGGAGLVRVARGWGKSEERRAASGSLPDVFEVAAGTEPQGDRLPTVPSCENLVNSPGTILRYRLPLESPESWTVFGFGLFAVLWNAILVLLAVSAGVDLWSGRTDWLLFAILVPFSVIGVAGIVLFVRALVLQASVGPTQVEIADHPLRPGSDYEVFVGQGGSGLFHRITLTLELEEMATFRQGTDTRTERRLLDSTVIREWAEVAVVPPHRFEATARVRVPAAAMHSFESPHNAVSWRLGVRVEPRRWPAFARRFPVVVLPAESPRGRQGAVESGGSRSTVGVGR